jgi:transcriptional regulator of NAD metabolism
MNGEQRREEILRRINSQVEPLSGSDLAAILGVSRQIIVQDIALLRAENHDIISTNRGYILQAGIHKYSRVFHVRHTNKQIADELNTIVDCGGRVLDVTVDHEVYGIITADLEISSRKDVSEFMSRMEANQTRPLKELTNGIHAHTVVADSEDILDCIHTELHAKGYLILES